jgi:hypothetical protein
MLSKRFPYAIYYKMEDGYAVIYAVLDCRWRPSWTAQELKQR